MIRISLVKMTLAIGFTQSGINEMCLDPYSPPNEKLKETRSA